ncbi:hypothetical protein AKJ09_11249 [Labilithrix luteola]|uniref:Rhodanese domain-containing protein n=2 Tax=Labilithrix luteola TaxID=1391654 RepID=A0A0K1QFM9_9BACT|nr:hypothetical protein AKJ09_11249 [Labilithrix luteola]
MAPRHGRCAAVVMLNLSPHAMSLLGVLAAVVILGIFVGSGLFYGARAHRALRMINRGDAILLDIDAPDGIEDARDPGWREVPFRKLEARAEKLGGKDHTIVLRGGGKSRSREATRHLRARGYRVINIGTAFSKA